MFNIKLLFVWFHNRVYVSVPKTSVQFMSQSSRVVGAQDPLVFDQVHLNEGSSWDTQLNLFQTRYAWGTYFVGLSAGIRSGFPVYNQLVNNRL